MNKLLTINNTNLSKEFPLSIKNFSLWNTLN